MSRSLCHVAGVSDDGLRLDSVLAEHGCYASRSSAARAAEEGLVLVNGTPAGKKHIVHAGDAIVYEVSDDAPTRVAGEPIDLDIRYEDDDLIIVNVKDYIKNPKPNGYRSLHVIIRIPVYFLDKKELIPVEIQLRTIAMDFWASLEHDLKYKAVRRIQGIDSYHELKDCSRIIEEVESRMQILARALDADEED